MIYVDEAIYPFRGRNWCHLFTDGDVEELHQFAEFIGLKRAWFQHKKPEFPHYDLAPAKRVMAVRNGAVEVTAQQMVAMVQAARAAAKGHNNMTKSPDLPIVESQIDECGRTTGFYSKGHGIDPDRFMAGLLWANGNYSPIADVEKAKQSLRETYYRFVPVSGEERNHLAYDMRIDEALSGGRGAFPVTVLEL